MLVERADGCAAFYLLLAIERDPQQFRDGPMGGAAPLAQGDAEQLLAHLAADLKAMLGDIRKCHLACAGALYDQSQILRPGMPVLAALAGTMDGEAAGEIEPRLTAIGAVEGRMPMDALRRDPEIPPALLLLLPLVALGPVELMEDLGQEMEHRFLAEGQVSAHTASWLQTAFGIAIAHARFMTFTDLSAMFRMQLEHFGYLPLWELIDAALAGKAPEFSVEATLGTRYRWREGRVWVRFQTFDHWASRGRGREVPGEGDALARGYAEWTRELRRYTSTLAAHRVPLRFELPEGDEGEVSGQWLYQEVAALSERGLFASITEHSHPELGIVAVTALGAEAMRHYYPLTPGGLNEIHDAIQGLELCGAGLAYSGGIELDPARRCLRPAVFDE